MATATQSWIAEITSLSESGDVGAALQACERAIDAWPDIGAAYRLHFRLAHQLGDRDRMIAALRSLVRHDPDDAESCAILGGLLCDAGDFAAVAAVLRPVADRLGDQGNVAWNYSSALAVTGAYAELRALRPLLDRLAAAAPSPYPPYEHLAMARLAAQADPAQSQGELVALQRSPRWIDADRTLAALAGAIADGTPFALLRLDIALAHFAALCGVNAQRILRPEERLAALDGVWTGWFGRSSQAAGDAALSDLKGAFLAAIADADIVGVPDAEDMDREKHHFGFLAEMHRLVRASTDALYASTHIGLLMHQTVPYLRTLLSGLPFLGFVGAHPAMFRKLAHFSGVSETATVLVPDEAGRPVASDGLDPAGFLPDGHRRVMESIAVPHRGAVFVVSAPGPLGVIYAARIKALGGIALDIGPLARQWAG